MTHKEQMQRGIEAALDAMPKRMRGCDMAHLFAQFIITYDMEPDTDDIAGRPQNSSRCTSMIAPMRICKLSQPSETQTIS